MPLPEETGSRSRIKTSRASLIGGIVVGLASFGLWTACAHELGADTLPWLAVGAVVSVGIGTWIRLADL
jgi:protein-S-isoprenylcysteine O-methyltransferase Ste14